MQVSGLGVEIATAIIRRYPTPGHLRRAYDRCMPDSTAAADLLATLPSSKSRTVGNAVSRAIFTQLFGCVFTPAIKVNTCIHAPKGTLPLKPPPSKSGRKSSRGTVGDRG